MILPRSFYLRNAREVAPDLLGRLLVTEQNGVRTSGRIVECEAYLGAEDPASHCWRGPTPRNEPMFRIGGHAYVYFIYGMYYCFNVVTGEEGDGQGILIRGIEPVEGVEIMKERRNYEKKSLRDLANGPGKVAIALGIGPAQNGTDLTAHSGVWLEPGEPFAANQISTTPRIGITKAVEHEWRFVVK